jgi:hypothetical protein
MPMDTSVNQSISAEHEPIYQSKKKKLVKKFGLRLKTRTQKLPIAEHLIYERSDMQVVPVNKVVDVEPRVRVEGNTVVIPICEEIIVKRVLIREEIRVTKQKTSVPYCDSLVIRKEKARIIREVRNLWPLKRLLRSFRY